jgi:hypothetical protein
MGIVEGGVLTCQFHNWRFDLATGACLQGVEGVRRYPTEVVADEVFIDPATDPGAADRHEGHLRRALELRDAEGVVRACLRLALAGGRARALGALVEVGTAWSGRGGGDLVAELGAAMALAERGVVSQAEAWALAAVRVCSALTLRRDELPTAAASPSPSVLLEALVEREETDSISQALALARRDGASAVVSEWLVPVASAKLWDRGAALVRAEALLALAPSLPESAQLCALAAVVRAQVRATPDGDLPALRSSRRALELVRTLPLGALPVSDPARLGEALARGAERSVRAVVRELGSGASPELLLREVAKASLERLARCDAAKLTSPEAAFGLGDAGSPLLLAASALAGRARGAKEALVAAQVVLASGLLGRTLGLVGTPTNDARPAPASLGASLLAPPLDASLGARLLLAAALTEPSLREVASEPLLLAAALPLCAPAAGAARLARHAELALDGHTPLDLV